MKTYVKSMALACFAIFLSTSLFAQKGGLVTIKIRTSAQCELCQETIEKAMAYEKGVKSSKLDLKTKILTVDYKADKTTPDKIRLAISKVGYDADSVTADPKAYEKLSPCCKKPKDTNYKIHE